MDSGGLAAASFAYENCGLTGLPQMVAGGDGEIRTHGGVAPPAVFKTAALDRSATSPVVDLLRTRWPERRRQKFAVSDTRTRLGSTGWKWMSSTPSAGSPCRRDA